MSNTTPLPNNNANDSAKQKHIEQNALLQCLVLMTKYYERPTSAQTMIAGLPLVGNSLTAEFFPRAAERARLSAQLNPVELSAINPVVLPVVLLLENEKACVLLHCDDDIARVIFPETGTGITTIKPDELANSYTGQAFYVKPNYQFSRRSEETFAKREKNWFWGVFTQSLPIYSEVLLASGLINLFALAIPLFIMNVYDRVVPNQAIETMWVLASGVGIVFLFDFILRTLRGYFIDSAGKDVDMRLSSVIFQHILGIQMGARPSSVGAFANSVQSFEIFRDFITSSSVTVIVDLPFVALYLTIIYIIGGNLVWIPLGILPFVLLVGVLLQAPITRLTQESYQHAAEKQATLIETLGGAEAIKSASAESTMQRRWEQIVALSARLGTKLRLVSNTGINFSVFAQQLASVLVVIFGVYQISEGELTTGALIACTIITGRAMAPMSQIAGLLTRYFQSVNALRSLNTIMQLPTDRSEEKQHLHRPQIDGGISFNNISFSYPESEIAAVHNINFTINPGERVAIIGRVGSGKTTIAKLIAKLYQPTQGNILIDGTDYMQIDPADLRYNIGYVPQDIVLFYGSVKDNIVLGAPYVEDEQVLTAAKTAGVDDFIKQHPHGYDLQVGERGRNLSRGQRQAIAVARAILLNPPIIIMDEPSTSMDDSSESLMRQKLKHYLRAKKTLVLITHKASMLELVDRLIVVEAGKIVADGPKAEVLNALQQGKKKS